MLFKLSLERRDETGCDSGGGSVAVVGWSGNGPGASATARCVDSLTEGVSDEGAGPALDYAGDSSDQAVFSYRAARSGAGSAGWDVRSVDLSMEDLQRHADYGRDAGLSCAVRCE